MKRMTRKQKIVRINKLFDAQPKPLTSIHINALCTLWDKGPATSYKLKLSQSVLDELITGGYANVMVDRKTIYLLSYKGRRELLLTGKRFAVERGQQTGKETSE